MLNHSIFSKGISSSVNGSSESCNTSDKDSSTPPQDPHLATDLLGVLPKQSMAERLRRATQFSSSNSNHHEKLANGIPKFFSIPALLGQYPISGGRKSAPLQSQGVETISTSIEGQQSFFPSTFASQQHFMQSGNNGNNMEQNVGGFYTSTATNGMLPDWAFGPIDKSALPGFSGFDFSSQEGQDINSLLTGAPLDGSAFYA